MVMCLLSPIFYLLILKLPIISLSLFFCIYILDLTPPVAGLNSLSILFFCIGAYFKLHNKSLKFERLPLYFIITLYSLFILINYIWRDCVWIGYEHRVAIILGVMCTLRVVFAISDKYVFPKIHILSATGLMIYFTHGILLNVMAKLVLRVVPISDITLLIVYILNIIFVLFIGAILYRLIKHIPFLQQILLGGR